jgi:hypothetical protein
MQVDDSFLALTSGPEVLLLFLSTGEESSIQPGGQSVGTLPGSSAPCIFLGDSLPYLVYFFEGPSSCTPQSEAPILS